jgi:hypothetical protein
MSGPTVVSYVSEPIGGTQHEPISNGKRSHLSQVCPPVSWRPGYKSGYIHPTHARLIRRDTTAQIEDARAGHMHTDRDAARHGVALAPPSCRVRDPGRTAINETLAAAEFHGVRGIAPRRSQPTGPTRSVGYSPRPTPSQHPRHPLGRLPSHHLVPRPCHSGARQSQPVTRRSTVQCARSTAPS